MLCGQPAGGSRVACGVSAEHQIHNTNILEPLVVEFPTSAAKDVANLVFLRNVLSASSERQYLLM